METIVKEWPIITSANIKFGNPESHTVVPTLWSKHGDILGRLSPEQYAIGGQLYSKYGVNLALRNWLGNTNIRHVVLCGADLSGSGQALVNLWEGGISSDRKIIGIDNAEIDEQIPLEAINRMRENVVLHDLRSLRPSEIPTEVQRFISGLQHLPPWGEAVHYPLPEYGLRATLPSEVGAHTVRGRTIEETYLKAVAEVFKFGSDAPTNYGNNARDLSNLVTVVTDEDPQNPQVTDVFPFNRDAIDEYIKQYYDPNIPEGLFYTYGERINSWGAMKIDQLKIILEKLRYDPNDRGALAVLYDPVRDNQLHTDTPVSKGDLRTSCITSFQAWIKDGKLEMVTDFRSNEMLLAWPQNAFALRHLQGYMGRELGYPLGSLTIVSRRAHIYEDGFSRTKKLIDTHGDRYSFESDPRGVFTIVLENGQIVMEHMTEDGRPLGNTLIEDANRNRVSERLAHQITTQGLISDPGHGIYLGRELQRADLAAKLGLPYKQEDQELERYLRELAEKARKYDEMTKS